MVKRLLLFLLLATTCLGQQYTLRDQAFLGQVQPAPFIFTNITNGLIAYWKCNADYGTTNVVDYSGNGNNATLSGNSSSNQFWIPRVFMPSGYPYATGLTFNTTYDLMASPNSLTFDFMWTNFSIGFWACHNPLLGPTVDGLFCDTTRSSVLCYRYGANWTVWNGELVMTGPAHFGSNWVYHVITRDGSNWTWWTNAVVCTTGVSADQRHNNPLYSEFIFGRYTNPFDPDYYWHGFVEEIRVHSGYCLSSNEVQYLYHNYYDQ